MIEIERSQVLAYRFAAHELDPSKGGQGQTVLASGIQDYPPGRSASLVLRLRTGRPTPDERTVLVHSVRGALHLHRAADLGRLAAALRYEDSRDMPPQAIGPFGAELAEAGIPFSAALDEVAAAMREAVRGGGSPTKGELSREVSPKVDQRLTPWCEGCAFAHVQDQLFRMATLQAGLVIDLDDTAPSLFRYRPAASAITVEETGSSRAALVRAFLATFGPVKPSHLASWLAITPAAARRWWSLVADELRPVALDGGKYWTHRDQEESLQQAPPPKGVRMLPPYDPLLELCDRALLVPDPAHRKAVWKTAANPGIVLMDGEIAGVWRQKRSRDRLTIRVETFAAPPAHLIKNAEPDAATIADYFEARDLALLSG